MEITVKRTSKRNSKNVVSDSMKVESATFTDLNLAKTLSFRGMKQNVSRAMMTSYFKQFGPIVKIQRFLEPDTGKTNGNGYIEFKNAMHAEHALRYSPHVISSSKIRLDIFRSSINDPQILPCKNSVCKQPCLKSFCSTVTDELCPVCYTEFPVVDLKPNSNLACIFSANLEASNSDELVQCPAYSNCCPNLIDCDHCDQYNNDNCFISNLELQTKIVVDKIANLKSQCYPLMIFKTRNLQSSTAISEGRKMEFLAKQIDTVVQTLKIAVDYALFKAEDQILVTELADTQQLLSAVQRLPHLNEECSALEADIDYYFPETDIKKMVLFVNDVTNLWSEMESIDKIIADSMTRGLNSLMLSKVFSTIEGRLESTCLLIRIGIQNARPHNNFDFYTNNTSSEPSIRETLAMRSFDGFVSNTASTSNGMSLVSDSIRLENTGSMDLNMVEMKQKDFPPRVIGSSNILVDLVYPRKFIVLCFLPYIAIWYWNQGFVSRVRTLPTILISFLIDCF